MRAILVSAVLISSLGGLSVHAQEFSASSDLTIASRYVFRGQKLAENTLHPSFELSGNGLYAGVWAALPLEQLPNWGDEFDFNAGYSPKISEKTTLDIGYTYYYYTNSSAPTGGGVPSTSELYCGATYSVAGFTPAAYVYYDFDEAAGAFTAIGSLGYSLPLKGLDTTLELNLSIGRVLPEGDGEEYTYESAEVSFPFEITESLTLRLGGGYANNNLDDVAEDDTFWFSAGVRVGF